ncbi:YobI family P-loop NTPase [Lysobacter sp. D1-1-M9]|uniref:YobI family P-loop NTPase n=2 Tax=Novilysobacter TaxID=3382699 RepID=UPI002FCA3405
MKKAIVPIARQLSHNLIRMWSWLESKDRSADIQANFVDLAPTDKADKAGVYSEAILFATSNTKVFNIALTGPYGSGKSSIIQTFLKKYQRPALHISLAAFIPEADSEGAGVSRQEIERSILQQMLYGADANRLPLSRFKRIQSPGVWSAVKSLFITLGILALWYVFSRREDIMSGDFFTPFALSNGFNLGICAFAAAFLWAALHHLYVASFGLSLKSISLKDVEIRPAHEDQTSVLNRHLDEIIYFFQSTDYDLVIIEDLDRFNDAEIFVTLRELNSLVNENAGVKRPVRFIYALRDDMFVNTDRTKFFEFIIPVIPIINSSNSIDMVLRQGRRLEIDGRLDRQFLREVSRYLNDLRLIQNIFNEYAIYVAHLEADGESLLDASKLLAILIYKNVYPRDFEQLHRGAGNLAEILNRQDKLIREGEAEYRTEIADLERRLEVAERQTPTDLKELRQIYAMALVEMLPAGFIGVGINPQSLIAAQELVGHDVFEKLIGGQRLYCRYGQGQFQQFDISKLQSEVDPQKSYLERKEEIESKTDEAKNKILHRIQDLRSKISKLRTAKLNELLRLNADRVEDVFKAFGEKGELARFLILEGHLDDTYYQYTSLFHSGRLSPNDNRFLIQIRAFVTPEPSFSIDNPKEVIAAMRDEDFRQSYALNVKIVDSLLSDPGLYPDQSRKFFELLSSEFERSEEFLEAYYTSGRDVAGLLTGLFKSWKDLVPAAIASANSTSHVSQLVANLPLSSLKSLARDFSALSEFVDANLPGILVNFPELAPERLGCLDFEVEDLAAIKEHTEIVRFMFEESCFKLTISNLEFAYQSILGESDLEPLRERNFTIIRSTNSAPLMGRVERSFDHYLRDILLGLQRNSKEDEPAILAVVCHETLNPDDLRKFLERQTNILSNLEDVPEKWHAMLFESNVIEPTWANCLDFMRADGFNAGSLVAYLDRDFIRSVILQDPMPGDLDSRPLRRFIVEAGALSDASYREYVRALPLPFKNPPQELGATKLRILIDEGKVKFTKESLDQLADDTSLQMLFVAANIDTYLAAPANFALDDDFREELLRSEIDQAAKLEIVKLMDLGALVSLPERSALIGPILDSPNVEISNLNGSIAQSLITNSAPIATQISLFNKYHSLMSDDEVRLVLDRLPEPYSEIKTGYRTPRLKNSPENLDLVAWLDARDLISSWSEDRFFSNDIKVNLYRG